jgi:hypothetical protein
MKPVKKAKRAKGKARHILIMWRVGGQFNHLIAAANLVAQRYGSSLNAINEFCLQSPLYLECERELREAAANRVTKK